MIYINRTQIQIDEQNLALMREIVESNKDMHDNCDMNTCAECHPKVYSMIHERFF